MHWSKHKQNYIKGMKFIVPLIPVAFSAIVTPLVKRKIQNHKLEHVGYDIYTKIQNKYAANTDTNTYTEILQDIKVMENVLDRILFDLNYTEISDAATNAVLAISQLIIDNISQAALMNNNNSVKDLLAIFNLIKDNIYEDQPPQQISSLVIEICKQLEPCIDNKPNEILYLENNQY